MQNKMRHESQEGELNMKSYIRFGGSRILTLLVVCVMSHGGALAQSWLPDVSAVAGGVTAAAYNTVTHAVNLDTLRSSLGSSPGRALMAQHRLMNAAMNTGFLGMAASLAANAIRNGGLPGREDFWGATGNLVGSYLLPLAAAALLGPTWPVILASTLIGGIVGETLFRNMGTSVRSPDPVASASRGILQQRLAGAD